jgi:hypothetical protein
MAGAASVIVACASQDSEPEYGVRAFDAPTGSYIVPLAGYQPGVPINRRWEELSPAEKDRVRARVRQYERNLPPDAEVPFPLEGLKPILLMLRDLQAEYKWRGSITEVLIVDKEGNVSNVLVLGFAPENFVSSTRRAFSQVKFKPARCGAQPCQMAFPIAMNFLINKDGSVARP